MVPLHYGEKKTRKGINLPAGPGSTRRTKGGLDVSRSLERSLLPQSATKVVRRTLRQVEEPQTEHLDASGGAGADPVYRLIAEAAQEVAGLRLKHFHLPWRQCPSPAVDARGIRWGSDETVLLPVVRSRSQSRP